MAPRAEPDRPASTSSTVAPRRGSAGPNSGALTQLVGYRHRRGGVRPVAKTPQPSTNAGREVVPHHAGAAAHAATELHSPPGRVSPRGTAYQLAATAASDMPSAIRNRCLFGRRQRKPVGPPVIEGEPGVFDVWPARVHNRQSCAPHDESAIDPGAPTSVTSVLARPQLVQELEKSLSDELQKLRAEFPDIPASRLRLVQPPLQELVRQTLPDTEGTSADSIIAAARASRLGKSKEARRLLQSKQLLSPQEARHEDFGDPCSREDALRIDRVRLFSSALAEFARHFTAYRPILLWILHEFDEFALYCHRHVWNPEAREEFKAQARADAAAAHDHEKLELEGKLAAVNASLAVTAEKLAKYESSQATIRLQLDERDRTIGQRDREIQENNEGRAALLARISRLEKELWEQRLRLEEPEKRINELQQQLKDQGDKLTRAQKLFEENDREKAGLKDKIERLEDQVREMKKKQQQNGLSAVMKAEIMQYKKRELDVLEINAALRARLGVAEERLKEAQEALRLSRGDNPSTPRPNWNELADVCALAAPSTMKKVQDMAGAYRQLAVAKETIHRELVTLQDMLGSAYRDDAAAAPPSTSGDAGKSGLFFAHGGEMMPDVRATWFAKYGNETHVPAHLRGVGRVPNLRLRRDRMQQLVRHMWMDRQSMKAGAPWDVFLAKFLAEHCPDGTEPDVFAYNVHHAFAWYSFDPFIGFTRNLVTGLVDEAVFIDMQQGVAKVRSALAATASESSDNQGRAEGKLLTKTKLASTLIDACADRVDVDVKKLIVASSRDCPGRTADVESLFNFDAEGGRFSHFLEELYDQYLTGRREYLAVLTDALYGAETDEDCRLSPPVVAKTLLAVDQHMPVQYLDETVARLFGVSSDQLFPQVDRYSERHTVGLQGERVYGCQDTLTSDVPDVIAMLHQGVVRRFQPPVATTATAPLVQSAPAQAAAGQPPTASAPLPDDTDDEAAIEAMAV